MQSMAPSILPFRIWLCWLCIDHTFRKVSVLLVWQWHRPLGSYHSLAGGGTIYLWCPAVNFFWSPLLHAWKILVPPLPMGKIMAPSCTLKILVPSLDHPQKTGPPLPIKNDSSLRDLMTWRSPYLVILLVKHYLFHYSFSLTWFHIFSKPTL